ncbi:MAG TPA: outer membrane beta-barrel protein [Anaeromyxobacteraceae bacterium]|nr:outer membrane beta-barrel protein [Anaeromyxobacteraceae bacterium]
MPGRERVGAGGLAVAALLALSAPGPARAEGDGFKIGEAGRLHLYGEVDGGYNSNALYTLAGAPMGSGVMDFIAGFKMDVASHLIGLNLGANVDYKLYLSTAASDAGLSHLFGGASLGFDVNKNGVIGVSVTDTFTSSPGSTSLSLASAAISDYNVLNVLVPYRPGGGTLSFTASGQWILQSYEAYGPVGAACNPLLNPTCTNQDINAYSYNQYGAKLQAKWDFLPRTAVVLEGSYFDFAPNNTTVSLAVQGVKVDGGVVGQVTSRLAVTVKGGWGTTIDTPQITGSTWLADLEIQYALAGTLDVRAGYIHDFAPDIGTAYAVYDYDRVFLALRWQISRFMLKLDGSWEYYKYILNGVNGPVWQLQPAVDYEVARWCRVGAYYIFTSRNSSEAAIPGFNYSQNQVFAYVRVTW